MTYDKTKTDFLRPAQVNLLFRLYLCFRTRLKILLSVEITITKDHFKTGKLSNEAKFVGTPSFWFNFTNRFLFWFWDTLLVQNAKLARFDPFVYLGNLFKSSERKPRALFFLDFQ
ncbi:hypothetical protein [Leptospira interrogans]|uniref:hypothetical protein n=1 Tax=Leptospira interrogans TaxID=173 RepID=UPI00077334A9|nr:hypothetical protein [Leptospira interrogans]